MEEDLRYKAKEIVEKIGIQKEHLIPILQSVQDQFNYLPNEILEEISNLTEISKAQITSVSTFYTQFRHHPAGKHMIKVCVGTACHVKGAGLVFDAIKRELNLNKGEDTDKDGLFTLEEVACLGCCTLAPVVQIDNTTYGKVNQNEIREMIDDFLSKSEEKKSTNTSFTKTVHASGEIRLGLGSCCVASGSEDVKTAVQEAVSHTNIQTNVKKVGCVGMCHQVPLLEIVHEGEEPVLYSKVAPEDVKDIISKHFKAKGLFNRIKNSIFSGLDKIYQQNGNNSSENRYLDLKEKQVDNFLNKQVYIATELKGILNPDDIHEYQSNGGFLALKKCMTSLSQQEVIEEIKTSGLKGRGGAGFHTYKKWELVANEQAEKKYIICNGDEGDPGAFMDRMLLESFPYRIIEGMIIAGYATGAKEGILYIRAEYPLAVQRIQTALDICYELDYLGKDILGSGFNFDMKIFQGAGAFICGEETALIASMEGERGNPRIRPPYPAVKGFKEMPTLVNNAETFSNVPWILRHGSKEFEKIGTENSKGTKVFALAGKVANGGLIEVPMGITIREIVNDIGGGIQNNKSFKAVQIGGPSGGCIPESLADTPVDFEHLQEIGAMMGSGGLVVLDESDCVVDIAKYFLSFTQDQSCGKCVFCRTGTKHMLNILEKITAGKGIMKDIDKLEDLAQNITKGSLCGLGKTAPNPVTTSIKYFREEYEAHIEGKCPAKKCTELITYTIDETCIGCTKCAQDCPTDAIEFKPYEVHSIDLERCIKCDVCRQVCPIDSVQVVS
jgi:NADH-quinone oxidoreductase subunit F